MPILYLISTGVAILLGVGLVVSRDVLARRLFPADSQPLVARDTQAVALSVLGVYFVIVGICRLVARGGDRMVCDSPGGIGAVTFPGRARDRTLMDICSIRWCHPTVNASSSKRLKLAARAPIHDAIIYLNNARLRALAAAAVITPALVAQTPLDPSLQELSSAPPELRVGTLHVRLKTEVRILAAGGRPGDAAIDGSITLLIDYADGVPTAVHADRVWLRSGDSIAAGTLERSAQLIRIDSGPWRREQKISGPWPSWLDQVDAVDVIVRVMRDSSQLGYVRVSGQNVVNYPRRALTERARPATERLTDALYIGAFMGGDLAIMQGTYRNGQFAKQLARIDVFEPGQPLRALDRLGRSVALRYDTIPVKEYYGGEPWEYRVSRYDSASASWVAARELSCFDSLETPTNPAAALAPENMRQRRACSDRWIQHAAAQGYSDVFMFWTGPVPVHSVQPTPVQLDSASETALERRGRALWSAAIAELDLRDRPTSMRFGLRRNDQVRGATGIVVSWWQVVLGRSDGPEDPRGAVFFIYSTTERKILYSTFGHPEWSPVSRLTYVRPYVYFRIGDDPRVYCLTEYSGAWESSGVAIFDVGGARPVIFSN